MDPLRNPQRPQGGLYRTARSIRDLPFSSTSGLAAAAFFLSMPGLSAPASMIYGGATIGATAKEVMAAAPTAISFLERLGTRRPEFSAPMVETKAAMTMRQASLRAIHDSGYFLRSVLGREASLMHK